MSFTVTVYSKPSCVQCNATYRALDSKGIDYEVLDLSEDPAALEQAVVRAIIGDKPLHDAQREILAHPACRQVPVQGLVELGHTL